MPFFDLFIRRLHQPCHLPVLSHPMLCIYYKKRLVLANGASLTAKNEVSIAIFFGKSYIPIKLLEVAHFGPGILLGTKALNAMGLGLSFQGEISKMNAEFDREWHLLIWF